MRSGFSAAFAAGDGRDPVPLQAPKKADSSATAGADSTPGAHIPCLGTLGLTDESVVNVKVSTGEGRNEGRKPRNGDYKENKARNTSERGFRE